ncbi:heme exporter protein CcmB [Sphingorhabdus sp. Alg239-R122]|uniref:heme exporter protein CcmB n=1 Tax=Sphingorhabdus sp. Alg239-R122 TaxID=2305989 RepID=UPI0013DC19A5|nr:heme exporter protein CcmB [Sphingorhabdus sp. Alg239-R122]
MKLLGILIWRDLSHAYGFGGSQGAKAGTRRGGFILPVIFFLAVAAIYPFAVGSDAQLLARTGGGVIWVAALLAAILPLDRLVQPDVEHGFFDQWAVRGLSEEWIMLAKIVAHWLSFGPPLMLATIIAAGLLGLDAAQLRTVEAGLALGTPGLAALGVMIAALTAGLKGGSALGGLMLLPLAVPMLIFGAGSVLPDGENGLLLLAAASLVLVAIAPFAAGAAIRALRE